MRGGDRVLFSLALPADPRVPIWALALAALCAAGASTTSLLRLRAARPA